MAAIFLRSTIATGRPTIITHQELSVEYEYDHFGRVTRDGELTYRYDDNGNRTEIGYPGGVTATYGYDFADRQETLDMQVGAEPVQALVTGSSYLPSGPLRSLALGNGITETRELDGRYVPDAIVLGAPTPRRWSYAIDGVGNIVEIETLIGCSEADLVLANRTVTEVETFTTCAGIEAGPAFSVETGGSVTFTPGTRIALGSGFSVKDGASFTAGIDSALSPVLETRSYSYQDFQYFLTGGDRPWGSLDWTYDLIGNRLTETRDGVIDTYTYVTNGGGGNTAILSQITLGTSGTRDYQFGAAGHLEQVTAGANQVVFGSDDEGRLADLSRPVAGEAVDVLYDGRSFMLSTVDPATGAVTEPTYSSEGLLHALRRQETPASPEQRFTYLYFAGRPVAQLELEGTGVQTLLYLITDHLGTPTVALDEAGAEVWDSAFEPFGRDAEEATPEGALANDVFLRFPGQWEDGQWAAASFGAEVFYNVHRWYRSDSGRYTRPDPLGLAGGANLLSYALGQPLLLKDPKGQQIRGDAHIPTQEEIEEAKQRSCARRAFYRNYDHMIEANWKKSDKYFHCKANCEATKCGQYGHESSCELSNVRELFDQVFKGDPPSATAADQAANLFGREAAKKKPGVTCQILCARYRPKGLPPKY